MGKNKEKQKCGDLLETAPASIHTCLKLQKDQLQADKDKSSPMTDSLTSMESSTETPKKKQKRKRLSEQHAEIEQHTEDHQEDRKRKEKKKKFRNEEANHVKGTNDADVEHSVSTEKPARKKTKEVNEAAESEKHSSEKSEESRKRKKKLKVSKQGVAEKRRETEEVNLAVESETESCEALAKEKKKDKSKGKERDSLVKQHKNVQSVFTTQETQTIPKIISQGDEEEDTEMTEFGTKESTPIDASLLKQLKEFIPDIESKEPPAISKMIKYDLPRFKEFKKHGIALNHGRFTAQENARLRKNVSDFMVLTAIDSATKLFFTDRFKQEQENIRKLKGLHKFFERIAEGIPRSCYYVYARGRKMFDEQNYQGEFTKEELHTLNKLHTLHGSNWKKISELTGRSAISLQKRYTQLAINQGPWSKKEIQRLLRAVRDHIMSQIPGGANSNQSLRVMKETLYKRLPLQKIAMAVKTRSWSQCREKWMGILAAKMSFGAVYTEKKSLDVQIKLIKRIYEMDVDDAARVDWEDLTALIGDVPPAYVQRKWHKLKVCHVPEWPTKCFEDIVDFLYEKVLPHLEQKLMSYKDLDETQHKENEESYLLSDIFQDINEDEDVDDEEDNNGENKEKETQ